MVCEFKVMDCKFCLNNTLTAGYLKSRDCTSSIFVNNYSCLSASQLMIW